MTLQCKCYCCLCNNMQCFLLQSLLYRNGFILTRRNIISCGRKIVRLTTKVFSDGHNWAKSCIDRLSKFPGLSLAVSYCHHGSIQPTVTHHSRIFNFLCPSHEHVYKIQKYISLLPSVGREMSTGQSAVMRCGWGVTLGRMAHSIRR